MKLDFSNERVLAVVAHPDDAELLCAGTLARARDGGAAIAVCVLCRGDKGVPPGADTTPEELSTRRHEEMQTAYGLLGAELFTAERDDGTLADDSGSRRELIETYRTFRPTLVLAHSSDDYHPDHQAASHISEAASWFCASRGHVTGTPPLQASPALWWMDHVNMTGFDPELFINVSEYTGLKERMLGCHLSQLQRAAARDFAPLLSLMRLQQGTRGAECGVTAAEAFRTHRAFKRTRAW